MIFLADILRIKTCYYTTICTSTIIDQSKYGRYIMPPPPSEIRGENAPTELGATEYIVNNLSLSVNQKKNRRKCRQNYVLNS